MFIYRISVNGQSYYGFDTKPVKKQHRWKEHKRNHTKIDNKLYKAMREHGIENCLYEVIEEGFDSISQLALAEIQYIEKNDTFKNGLNSSKGGDGFGRHNLIESSDSEIQEVKKKMSESMSEYNKKVKWLDKTPDERRQMTSHLFTDEANQKKSGYVKKNWQMMTADEREYKLRGLKSRWHGTTPEERSEQNRKYGVLGAMARAKKIKVEFNDGSVRMFETKKSYTNEFGHDLNYILKFTAQGGSHNGKKAWVIK